MIFKIKDHECHRVKVTKYEVTTQKYKDAESKYYAFATFEGVGRTQLGLFNTREEAEAAVRWEKQ